MTRWIISILLVAQAYALLRYAVFKGVGLAHWPLYLNNKAISLAGLILLAASFALRRRAMANDESAMAGRSPGTALARAGFALIVLHVLLSLPILSPGYFPQFFDGDKMNLTGELSLLLGALSFGCCLAVAMKFATGDPTRSATTRRGVVQRLAAMMLVLAAGHVLVMGISGWLKPRSWPGGLPPVTFLAFLAAVAPLVWSSIACHRRSATRGRGGA